MAEPSKKTIKRLFALSGNICAFPSCQMKMVEESGTVTGEICHIEAQSNNGPRFNNNQTIQERHSFDNLILLCAHHHKIIDSESDIYTAESIRELKSIHEKVAGRTESLEDSFFAQLLLNKSKTQRSPHHVAINSPGAIQTTNINIKANSKNVSVSPPEGTIGSIPVLTRYISYLIKRYNNFASENKARKSKFSYGAISKNIESNFGAKWQLVDVANANKVIHYLHGRIDRTIIAKVNKNKGRKSYSTLEEFINKHEL